MSAAPPNPVSFPSHQAAASPSSPPPAGVRHHQLPHRHHHHRAPSNSTPAASGSGALDVSSPSQGTHATSSSSYHPSSYATAPSSTPHQHQSQSYHHQLSTPVSTNIHQSTSSSSLAHMARIQSHFVQLAPSCSAHLADQNAIPIVSTTPHPGSPGLSSLSAAFVQAHDTASRLGLGVPLRVTVTTGLVGTVIAPGDRLAEARIASWGVEEVARKFQRYMCDGK
ncbi:hypothetical protein L211DRAFT_839410 [Terfezia boudieri ATCC MYA-4762]|uniref:Uncharacterized protein n=1 Tax=Terfezia boudieri ATCC MYA-4762 TaxID=1051890 RepID=A0A3N4LMH3_9PEZI|nr:hypothetical protein L211DRAFT_839410 [Terfezia boudieri ATCC MYA-4762]